MINQEERDLGQKPKKKFRVLKTFLLVLALIIAAAAIALGIYVSQNMHYDEKPLKNTYSAGYIEKQVTLDDGTYELCRRTDNGPALC